MGKRLGQVALEELDGAVGTSPETKKLIANGTVEVLPADSNVQGGGTPAIGAATPAIGTIIDETDNIKHPRFRKQ